MLRKGKLTNTWRTCRIDKTHSDGKVDITVRKGNKVALRVDAKYVRQKNSVSPVHSARTTPGNSVATTPADTPARTPAQTPARSSKSNLDVNLCRNANNLVSIPTQAKTASSHASPSTASSIKNISCIDDRTSLLENQIALYQHSAVGDNHLQSNLVEESPLSPATGGVPPPPGFGEIPPPSLGGIPPPPSFDGIPPPPGFDGIPPPPGVGGIPPLPSGSVGILAPPSLGILIPPAIGGMPPTPTLRTISAENLHGYPARKAYAPQRPMKRLHWVPVKIGEIKGTVWEDMLEDIDFDTLKFEEAFGEIKRKAKKKDSKSLSKKSVGEGDDIISLVTDKREENIGIMLRRFKMSPIDLHAAILAMDDNVVSLENLPQLQKILPNDEEMKAIQSFDGDSSRLSQASSLQAQLSHIPKLAGRLKFCEDRLRFPSAIDNIVFHASTLTLTANALMESPSLKIILNTVLTLGNYLNAGTRKGGCYGFRVEALNKLSMAKSTISASETLLTYTVALVRDKYPSAANFVAEVRTVNDASKMDFAHVRSEAMKLLVRLQKLGDEVKRLRAAREPYLKPLIAEKISKKSNRMVAFLRKQKGQKEKRDREERARKVGKQGEKNGCGQKEEKNKQRKKTVVEKEKKDVVEMKKNKNEATVKAGCLERGLLPTDGEGKEKAFARDKCIAMESSKPVTEDDLIKAMAMQYVRNMPQQTDIQASHPVTFDENEYKPFVLIYSLRAGGYWVVRQDNHRSNLVTYVKSMAWDLASWKIYRTCAKEICVKETGVNSEISSVSNCTGPKMAKRPHQRFFSSSIMLKIKCHWTLVPMDHLENTYKEDARSTAIFGAADKLDKLIDMILKSEAPPSIEELEAARKKKLAEIDNDRFYAVMSKFAAKATQEAQDALNKLENGFAVVEEARRYFGDCSGSEMKAEDFFSVWAEFSEAFARTWGTQERKRIKEEKASKQQQLVRGQKNSKMVAVASKRGGVNSTTVEKDSNDTPADDCHENLPDTGKNQKQATRNLTSNDQPIRRRRK